MNIRLMSLVSVFLSASIISAFAMESDKNSELGKRDRSEVSQQSADDALREIQRARHQAYLERTRQQAEANKRELEQEAARQEELKRQAQAQQLQDLERQQDLFNALEALINTLNILIDALESVPDFDTLCQQIDGIIDVIGDSNLSFASLKESGNEIIVAEINNLHNALVSMVTKIQANPITNHACFNFRTINDQLAIVCQLVGFNGDIKVELQDMYTEEDDAIAEEEYKQYVQVATQGDENFAGILAAAQKEEQDAADEALARQLQGNQPEAFQDDEEVARRLQAELDGLDEFDGRF